MTKVEKTMKSYTEFVVPPSVATKAELSRLVHEAEWIDGELTTKSVRSKVGVRKASQIVLSDQLTDLLDQNKLNILSMASRERTELLKQLRLLKEKVPVIHMTFASVADSDSLNELISWMRESIHAQVVISVGLQPALVAGVYLRTSNHVHDFSLRSQLKSSHDILVEQVEALHG